MPPSTGRIAHSTMWSASTSVGGSGAVVIVCFPRLSREEKPPYRRSTPKMVGPASGALLSDGIVTRISAIRFTAARNAYACAARPSCGHFASAAIRRIASTYGRVSTCFCRTSVNVVCDQNVAGVKLVTCAIAAGTAASAA